MAEEVSVKKQITAGSGPNDNWRTLDTAAFFKLKETAEQTEGCQLGSKGPWVKGSDPDCTNCKTKNLPCEHHASSCFYTYPWLRADRQRHYNNSRGHSHNNSNRGGYRNSGNGPYNRRGGRNGK